MSTSILPAARRPPVVSKGWVQLAALVSLSGFFVLVLMGFLTYQSSPPTPQRVVSASGQTVFTGADIRAGQDVYLRNGLMENGSIFGHGAYLGPDFTAGSPADGGCVLLGCAPDPVGLTSSAQACRYSHAVNRKCPGWAVKSRYPCRSRISAVCRQRTASCSRSHRPGSHSVTVIQ